jgi:hypothetical protein
MSTLLQTTIAGSLPKPAWLAPPGQLWAPWLLADQQLVEGKRDAVRLALFDQEHAGIDIVTDGEQTRRHFVTSTPGLPWPRGDAGSPQLPVGTGESRSATLLPTPRQGIGFTILALRSPICVRSISRRISFRSIF